MDLSSTLSALCLRFVACPAKVKPDFGSGHATKQRHRAGWRFEDKSSALMWRCFAEARFMHYYKVHSRGRPILAPPAPVPSVISIFGIGLRQCSRIAGGLFSCSERDAADEPFSCRAFISQNDFVELPVHQSARSMRTHKTWAQPDGGVRRPRVLRLKQNSPAFWAGLLCKTARGRSVARGDNRVG